MEEQSGSGGKKREGEGVEMMLDVLWSFRQVFPLTLSSLCVPLSPDDVPAGVGLQESAEQIPGQCSLQAR